MIKLFGIAGPAGHGKDTVGAMLKKHMERHGVTYDLYAFADPIKALVHHSFKAPVSWETREGKELEQEFTVSYWELHDMLENGSLHAEMDHYGVDFREAYEALMTVLEDHCPHTEVSMEFMMLRTSWRQLYQLIGTEWGREKVHKDLWINMAPTEGTIVTDVRGHGDHPDRLNIEAEYIRNHGGFMIEVFDSRKGSSQCKAHASEAKIDPQFIDHTLINIDDLEYLDSMVAALVSKVTNNAKS